MNQESGPRLTKLPFLLGDALLLAAAGWLVFQGGDLGIWQSVLLVAAVALAALFGVLPFIIEFKAAAKAAETAQLAGAVEQFQNLEELARRVAGAGAEWQQIHHGTTQTVTAAGQIAEKIVTEAQEFAKVLAQMNEREKQHLRLEVEKLRRGEAEWLQILVRMLDHIHALYMAGLRSGQKNIIDQLTSFQAACRDTARRVGLLPVLPAADAPFDAQQHQIMDGQEAGPGAVVSEILAPGYTFQGQLLRLPLVTVKAPEPAPDEKAGEPEPLPLFGGNA
jgi:molecular chaperone GrpE (heat shock protein)